MLFHFETASGENILLMSIRYYKTMYTVPLYIATYNNYICNMGNGNMKNEWQHSHKYSTMQTSTHIHASCSHHFPFSMKPSLGGRNRHYFIHTHSSGTLLINRGSADIITKDQIGIKCLQLSCVLIGLNCTRSPAAVT
jgi:hypothetical protein